jgi:UDP:flavonoid glycosyltransferase YjiC (YdhE family)
MLYRDLDVTANEIENWKLLIQQWGADAVLDSFGPTGCTAARILRVPQVQILQADFHPESRFTWWLPPQATPSPVAAFNAVLEAAGLPPVDRASRLLLGEATVVVGSRSTDPVPDPNLPYVGVLSWDDADARLPAGVPARRVRPLIFVYGGQPSYRRDDHRRGVIVDAAVEVLGGRDLDVVIGAGNQLVPESLPSNFMAFDYAPGQLLARRADVMIHHGGHGSSHTALAAGTPALIVATSKERESNARRVANLGAGLYLLPEGNMFEGMHLDTELVFPAVDSLLRDSTYKESAHAVSEELRALPGAQYVADLVESVTK